MSEEDELEGVSPEQTEVSEEGDSPDDSDWDAFEELYEDYKPTGQRVTAEDGMPSVGDTGASADDIPPLSPETLICMEDRSEFVVRDEHRRILERLSPADVIREPDGSWFHVDPDTNRRVRVEPIRPPCQHYVRQVGQLAENRARKIQYRLCSARRSTEGAFMSVRDTGFWACSMREPRDLESEEKHLEAFDELKKKQGENRVKYSIFGSHE